MIEKSIQVQRRDGTTFTHTARFIRYEQTADGAVMVEAACCNKVGAQIQCSNCGGSGSAGGQICPKCHGSGAVTDEDTRSRHTFYDVAALDDTGILSQVQAHVDQVAAHHAGAEKGLSLLQLHIPSPALTNNPGSGGGH